MHPVEAFMRLIGGRLMWRPAISPIGGAKSIECGPNLNKGNLANSTLAAGTRVVAIKLQFAASE